VSQSKLPESLKRFKFLAAKIASQQQVSTAPLGMDESYNSQLNQYINEVQQNSFSQPSINTASAVIYWQNRLASLDKLAPVALDILAAPASQAYVERIFSICGLLTSGHRNRMQKSLAMRVCLRLNKKTLHDLGCL
jgi:hAT family C-terminal dimerisation region